MDREAWWASVHGVTVRHNWPSNTVDTFTSLSLCYDPNWVKKQLYMLTE